MLNNTMIPSVQVGAGIPLQSTQMSMAQSALPQQSVAQSAVQQNMAPVQAGSILQLPPGSMVPVQAGNSIVYVPTQPIATQQVSVQPQVQYQTQTYQAPVETQVQSQFDPSTANLQEAPQYGNTTTPQLKTLQPRIVRNELPPQYKRVVLPAKVITTRLPPIGPPPTPELNFQLPPPAETYPTTSSNCSICHGSTTRSNSSIRYDAYVCSSSSISNCFCTNACLSNCFYSTIIST